MKSSDLKEYLKKSVISIIIIAIILGFTYGERLISTSFSIDTEIHMYDYVGDATWWNSLGRWGLVLINKIFFLEPLIIFHSNFFMFIFIILSSIAYNYLISLYIDKKYKETFLKYQFIFPIIFYTNPIFAEQFNFTNQNFAVSLCMFLIPLLLISFKYIDQEKNKTKRIIFEIINIFLMSIIFGTYQSLILLYIASVALIYFIKCFSENDNNFKWLITNIIRFVISAIIYFVIGKIVGEDNPYLNSGYQDGFMKVIKNIYEVIISMLKCDSIFYNVSFLIALVFFVVIFAILKKEKRINVGTILGELGLVLSPLYIMIITGVDQYKRTQFNYSFVIGLSFIILIILINNYKKLRYIAYSIVILGTMIAYKQGVITATLFSGDNIRFEYDRNYAERIVQKIEEKDWYDKNSEYILLFVGNNSVSSPLIPLKGEVIGSSFFYFDYQYHYGPTQRATIFINELGYTNFKKASNDDIEELFKDAKKYVKENDIKSFPSDESIINRDNTIIVKLSDELD